MKILLTGGGTMGSVTPLLAMAEVWRRAEPSVEFFWLGTKTGPESAAVTAAGITFQAISGGKLRRYWSGQNLLEPGRLFLGFWQSWRWLRKNRPELIIAAGGFIAVPVVWAGWLLGIPSLVHQQDVIPGLANRLMALPAKKITVALADSQKHFAAAKTVWLGNPVRPSILTGQKASAVSRFNFLPDQPTLLVVGGGTGALKLNQVTAAAVPPLTTWCQVIHLTGKAKAPAAVNAKYHPFEFLTSELADVYAAADVVVTRAGFGFLSELAALGKAVIIVPLPDSHQEANANYFVRRNAAWLLPESELTPDNLVTMVKNLLDNRSDRANLERNIKAIMKPDAAEAMMRLARELTNPTPTVSI